MEKVQITTTSFMAGLPTRLAVAAAALLALYYRTPLLFLLLTLGLTYLLWSYYWTWASCNYTLVEKGFGSEQVFPGDTITRKIRFSNGWIFPMARCRLRLFIPPPIAFGSDREAMLARETESSEPIPPGQIGLNGTAGFAIYLACQSKILGQFQLTPNGGDLLYSAFAVLTGSLRSVWPQTGREGTVFDSFPHNRLGNSPEAAVYEGEQRENNYG